MISTQQQFATCKKLSSGDWIKLVLNSVWGIHSTQHTLLCKFSPCLWIPQMVEPEQWLVVAQNDAITTVHDY